MYKLLLCWRYLKTRYLALVCIVSVMLGVATLIVVNSVMAGFSTKLKERLHGLLSDIVIETPDLDGFGDPNGKIQRIRDSEIGQYVAAMTPQLEVFSLLQFQVHSAIHGDNVITKTVRLIGIEPKSRTEVGGFAEYLYGVSFDDPNKPRLYSLPPSFELNADAQRYYERLFPPALPQPDPPL